MFQTINHKMGPNVYYFNPTAEMAIANGLHSYQPPGLLQTFEKEMATLMLYFALPNDIVVVKHKPQDVFLKNIQKHIPELPTFLTLEELNQSDIELNMLIPWAWSPVVHKTFEPALKSFSKAFQNSMWRTWKSSYKTYFDRQTAAEVLKAMYDLLPQSIKPSNKIIPKTSTSIQTVRDALTSYGSIVLKTPFSSSGRGLQMLRKDVLNASNIAWIESALEKQSRIMYEHLHQKEADLSFHFKLEPNKKPQFLGTVYFNTNSNGQFNGCFLHNHPNKTILSCVNTAIELGVVKLLSQQLQQKYNHYSGYIGIDAMVINENNALKLHPCVEINPRFTMGLLTLKLRSIFNNPNAYWEIIFSKKGQISSRITENSLALTPVNASTQFAAILHLNP